MQCIRLLFQEFLFVYLFLPRIDVIIGNVSCQYQMVSHLWGKA